MSEAQAAQTAIEVIGLDNAIAIVAVIVATGASSALTYNRNKKSEQIKIAREQMDKISKEYERLLEVKIKSLVNEGISSQLIFVYHIEEM
ncbi:MAG: hypothetical protein ACRD8W_28780 [Nitrososphaeraceae archaeon]